METETKLSIAVAVVLVSTAIVFYPDLRIPTGIATIYLIVNAVQRIRKRKAKSS